MKKIISLILVISVIISALTVTAVNAEDNGQERYIKILYNLGISERTATADSLITRAEFAEILTNLLDADDIIKPYTKGSFLDVDGKRAEAAAIDFLYNMGIMVDIEDGKFRPDDNLKFSEACEAIVRLLGYKDMGEAKGFTNAAVSVGAAKGVKSTGEFITMGQLAKMLYNSLDIQLAEYTVLKDGVTVGLGNTVLLRDYLGITEASGRVTAVKGMSLYGLPKEDLTEMQVEIDNVLYETLEYFSADRLGSKINFWYRENDEDKNEIIYAEFADNSSEITLNYSDVKKLDGSVLEYELSGKTKKLKLSGNMRLIKNGVPFSSLKDIDFNKKGTLKFALENDKCVAVIALEYKSYVVDTVGSKIRFKYDADFSIKTNDTENDYIITDGKNYYNISDIEPSDVLSVAHDDSTSVYFIRFSRKSVYGEITKTRVKNGEIKIEIGGNEYGADADFYALCESGKHSLTSLIPGLTSEFCVDFSGDICGMSYTDDLQYAYVKAAGAISGDMAEDYALKIFTQRQKEFKIYKLAKRVVYNGASLDKEEACNKMKDFLTACEGDEQNPPVMKFKENLQGEITEIVNKVVKGYETSDSVLQKPVPRYVGDAKASSSDTDGYRFAISYKKFYTADSRITDSDSTYNQNFYNDIHIYTYDGETDVVCMKIPPDGNEEDFEVGVPYDLGIYKDWSYHDVIFYDLNEFYEPAFMLLFASGGTATIKGSGQTVVGVESVETVFENGEAVTKLTGYYNGVETVYTVPEDKPEIYSLAKTLQKGDFVQLEADYKNKITGMKFYFTYNVDSFDFSRLKDGGDIYDHFVTQGGYSILLDYVKNANENFVAFEGDPTVSKLVYCLDYDYPAGGQITMFDGESFSKIKFADIRRDDVIFAIASPGSTFFRTIVVLRDLDSPLISANKILP